MGRVPGLLKSVGLTGGGVDEHTVDCAVELVFVQILWAKGEKVNNYGYVVGCTYPRHQDPPCHDVTIEAHLSGC